MDFGIACEAGRGLEKFGENEAGGPDIDGWGVVFCAKEKLRTPVPDRYDAGGYWAGAIQASHAKVRWRGVSD